MGSFLRPLLANSIMTELEQKVIKQLFDDKTLMLYDRYVHDTLVVIKPRDLDRVHNALNNFFRNSKFALETSSDVVPYFIDIEIHPDGLGIYCKPTNTGQYPKQ